MKKEIDFSISAQPPASSPKEKDTSENIDAMKQLEGLEKAEMVVINEFEELTEHSPPFNEDNALDHTGVSPRSEGESELATDSPVEETSEPDEDSWADWGDATTEASPVDPTDGNPTDNDLEWVVGTTGQTLSVPQPSSPSSKHPIGTWSTKSVVNDTDSQKLEFAVFAQQN